MKYSKQKQADIFFDALRFLYGDKSWKSKSAIDEMRGIVVYTTNANTRRYGFGSTPIRSIWGGLKE